MVTMSVHMLYAKESANEKEQIKTELASSSDFTYTPDGENGTSVGLSRRSVGS